MKIDKGKIKQVMLKGLAQFLALYGWIFMWMTKACNWLAEITIEISEWLVEISESE